MSTATVGGHDEFGGYVLLKKLGEDGLGETYRAGKLGSGGMQQVVLLKIWNGSATDPETLWRHLSTQGPVQAALRSPNVASGIDLGRVRNIPYSAYDYVSGKSLASLLAQIGRERSPVPTDHALLIADRIALGVSAGYETRLAEQRILHGFLVPQLLMLGNEGDMKVLGFEAAQGLRAGGAPTPDLARYLSPEALAGAPVHKADDVYSLGAILYELLTAERLPTQGARGAIDTARLANDGSPLPADIASLLKKSLAGQAERIPDVIAWHRALSKVAVEGQYNATTFNLAFFMHNLFRDEIDRESKEIEKERTQTISKRDLFAAAGAGSAATAPTMPLRTQTAPVPSSPPPTHGLSEEAPAAGNKNLLWGGIAALVLVGAGLGVYFGVLKKPADEAPPATETTAPVADPNAADATVTAEPPNAEQEAEIRSELEKLLAERTAAMEKNLKAQYDEKIRSLQQSLEQSQRPASAPTTVAARPATVLPSTPTTTSSPPPEPAPAPTNIEPPPTQEPEQVASATPPESTPPASQPAPEPVAAKPTKPQVRVGDLVEMGPGVVAPKLKTMPNPIYPPAAKRLNKTAVVTVRVLVDENGRVQRSEVVGGDPGFGFGDAALAAARGARFDSATSQGVRVKMWTAIKVSFQP